MATPTSGLFVDNAVSAPTTVPTQTQGPQGGLFVGYQPEAAAPPILQTSMAFSAEGALAISPRLIEQTSMSLRAEGALAIATSKVLNTTAAFAGEGSLTVAIQDAGLPALPGGYKYVVDKSGNYVLDRAGNYVYAR